MRFTSDVLRNSRFATRPPKLRQGRARYPGRNVVERCFKKLKRWRGIAMRSDKTACTYHAGLGLAATLHWLTSAFSNTA